MVNTDGILPLIKPAGPSSHDMVYRLRKILPDKKIGHSGTLDPFAEGILLMGIGKGTRILEYYGAFSKVYILTLILGVVTDTYDITGNIVEENECLASPEQISETVLSFKGDYLQVPPMYSAKKYNGKKLYDLARKGKIISMPPKKVEIKNLEILDISIPEVTLMAEVSGGTYLRSLAADIGFQLGCGAVAKKLVRVSNCGFSVDNAVTIDSETEKGEILKKVVSLEDALPFFPKLILIEGEKENILNGRQIFTEMVYSVEEDFEKDALIRILSFEGEMLAIAKSERRSGFVRTLMENKVSERVAALSKVLGY